MAQYIPDVFVQCSSPKVKRRFLNIWEVKAFFHTLNRLKTSLASIFFFIVWIFYLSNSSWYNFKQSKNQHVHFRANNKKIFSRNNHSPDISRYNYRMPILHLLDPTVKRSNTSWPWDRTSFTLANHQSVKPQHWLRPRPTLAKPAVWRSQLLQ